MWIIDGIAAALANKLALLKARVTVAAAVLVVAGAFGTPLALAEPTGPPVPPGNSAVPSDQVVTGLADETMRIFMSSVRAKSMAALWQHISNAFRNSHGVVDLDNAFKSFFTYPFGSDPLAGRTLILKSRPHFNEQGSLMVEGYYDTTPQRLTFQLAYVPENGAWKLIGLQVSTRKPDDAWFPPVLVSPRKLQRNEV